MKTTLLIIVAGIAAVILAGTFGLLNRENASTKLSISGSNTIAPLIADIARRYETLHPTITVDVRPGGSRQGITDTRSSAADIGMVARPAKPEESDLLWFPFAQEGLAIIAHKNNPLKNLTRQQLIEIYAGNVSSWDSLDSSITGEIVVVHGSADHSMLDLFLQHVELSNNHIKADIVVIDHAQAIATVDKNEHAIAFASIGTAAEAARKDASIKLLDADGIGATITNVNAGRYPIARTLYLVSQSEPDDTITDFLRFAASDHVQDLIEGHFFLPLQQE